MNEFEIIARYFAPLAAGEPGSYGLEDDAARLGIPDGQDLVLTADGIVAGVHFLPDDPPEDIAAKLLRVNLSDLAAKGARPRGYLLTAAFPKDLTEDWLAGFAGGLKADGAAYGLPLLGGDTVATPGPLTLSVTAFGLVPKGRMLRRAGARAGDTLFVTGTIGDGVLGLAALRQRLTLSPEDAAFLSRRYRRPEPRTALGPLLLEHGLASACLDLSDGLAADAGHLASASRVRLTIEAHRVPLSAPALHQIDLGAMDLPELFTGGDDYELLFTAPPEAEATLRALAQETGTAIAAIGRAEAGEGVRVLDPGGAALDLPETGYTHFS